MCFLARTSVMTLRRVFEPAKSLQERSRKTTLIFSIFSFSVNKCFLCCSFLLFLHIFVYISPRFKVFSSRQMHLRRERKMQVKVNLSRDFFIIFYIREKNSYICTKANYMADARDDKKQSQHWKEKFAYQNSSVGFSQTPERGKFSKPQKSANFLTNFLSTNTKLLQLLRLFSWRLFPVSCFPQRFS